MIYPLPDLNDISNTKDRILLAATILFAHRGYAAVSVRDIADSVNIKAASIYNHYANKEALFDAILDTIKETYLDFYVRLDAKVLEATCFKEVLDCILAEVKEVYDIYIYYGISLVVTEQFRNKKAREVYENIFIRLGIDYSKNKFDECIEKNWVKPFDTETAATLLMNSVAIGTLTRTHEAMEQKEISDAREMFISLEKFLLNSVEIIKN